MAQAIYKLKKNIPGFIAGTEFYHYSKIEVNNGIDGLSKFKEFVGSDGVICPVRQRSNDTGDWNDFCVLDGSFRNDKEWFGFKVNFAIVEIEALILEKTEEIEELKTRLFEAKKQI